MTTGEIEENAQDPDEWIITLVHGTWGRGKLTLDRPRKSGPRWFEDKSDFRNRLEGNLKHAKVPNFRIDTFLWSGANSILERNEAAGRLAKRLADQQEPKRPIKQVIIAHSHGGNIALRAIELFEGRRDNLFVATMATPFLEIFAPQIWDVSAERKFFAVSLGVTVLLSLLLLFSFEVAAVAITPAMLLGFSLVLVGDEIERRRREQESPTVDVDQLAEATSRQSLKQNGVELLVLRGVDDEASLTIAAGAIGARFSNVIARLTSTVPMRAYMMFFLTLPMLVILMGILHGLEVPAWETILGVLNFLITWQVVVIFFLCVSSIVLVCSIIPLACNAVYGWELSYWFFNAVVNVGSVPDINGTVTVHTLIKEDYTGFRHYLYDNGDCELWIVQWVLARSQGQDLPTYLDQRRNLRAPYEEYVQDMKMFRNLNEKSKRPPDGN